MKNSLAHNLPRRRRATGFFYFIWAFSAALTCRDLLAFPRPPVPPLVEQTPLLYHEDFDVAYFVRGTNRTETVTTDYGTLVSSWSGYALERAGTVAAFVVPALDGGYTNVACEGGIRFWLTPYWSSAATNGTGPGVHARLLELVAVGEQDATVAWSFQVNTNGNTLSLIGPGESGPVELLSAAIAWVSNTAHCVVLNYASTGTVLYVDGRLAAAGSGTYSVSPNLAGLVVGSTLTGTDSFGGYVDKVYAFGQPLSDTAVAFHHHLNADEAALGAMTAEELAEQNAGGEDALDGGGGITMRVLVGGTTECITNVPVYITNIVSTFFTNDGWTVTFDVQGSYDGTTTNLYDIFTTTNLIGDNITNAQWIWLERGPSCSTYQYTNQSGGRSFYIVGTPRDSDGDGLTDAYELLVSRTSPTSADTDGDGMPDGWEVAHGLNPLVNDADDDPDGDWLTNYQEYNGGTNSTDPHELMIIAWGDNRFGQCNVPLNLRDVKAIAAGYDFSLALKNDGTVVAWGANDWGQTNVAASATNVTAISAAFHHALALRTNGSIAMWGQWWWGDDHYPVDQPAGLTNVTRVFAGANHDLVLRNNGAVSAWSPFVSTPYTTVPTNVVSPGSVAAGYSHSVATLGSGTVLGWGENYASPMAWNVTNIPAGLSNVIALAAGDYHTLALKSDGKIVAWGAGNSITGAYWADFEQSIVPAGLSNVISIAAAGYRSLALRSDGSIVGWGDNLFGQGTFPYGTTNCVAIAAGPGHSLAIRTGRQIPLILESPEDQFTVAGSNATFTALGLGLAGVHYQWQFNGTNISLATNASLTLNSVSANDEGNYRVVISTGAGSVTSSWAAFMLIRPPILVSQTLPDRQWAQSGIASLSANVSGLFLNYHWKREGTNIVGSAALNSSYPVPQFDSPEERHYSMSVTNAAGYTNTQTWTVKSFKPGGIAAWGRNDDGELDWPATASNIISVAAGKYHSVAAREDGTVIQWGYQWASVPVGLSNVVAVSAGYAHTLALRENGTVTNWGDPTYANTVPTNNSGLEAISAGTYHNLALLTNGTVTAWGLNGADLGWHLTEVPPSVSNATAVAAGSYHSLALRSDGMVISWGYNDSGQTNVPSGLSNVVAIAAGQRFSLALKADGTISAWGQNGSGECNVPAGLSNVMAISAGWEHAAALKNDGTVVCWGANDNGQTNIGAGLTGIKLIAAGGNHIVASVFSTLVQYAVDVPKDLLLIYNTNSPDSSFIKNYYLAHRPLVSEANVLGIACPTPSFGCPTNETALPAEYTNNIATPIQQWLAANPTKRPQYVILFPDIPSRVSDFNEIIYYTNSTPPYVVDEIRYTGTTYSSVGFQIHDQMGTWRPFVTHINMGDTNACKAYIDKLEFIGMNYCPGSIVVSASAGGYGNTNYVLDSVRISEGNTTTNEDLSSSQNIIYFTSNALFTLGVATNALMFAGGYEICTGTNSSGGCTNFQGPPHIGIATNIAGYISLGAHSLLDIGYALDGKVQWKGNSSWYIIETIESHNGMRYSDQGSFLKWYSANAFGGTNYSNTPVGAVGHTDEPSTGGVNNPLEYFGLWERRKNFAIASWNSRQTERFLAVGDPFVRK